MSAGDAELSDFERQTRAVLEESVTRIDGRLRSRLTQARHAALAEAAQPRWSFRRRVTLAPAGALAAAAAVALVMWSHHPQPISPLSESGPAAVEDMELLSDKDGLDLIQGSDGSGFYEWAAGEEDAGSEASSS